ncbi:MAG: metal-dependent hydrolase [Candidatus Thorarchaeota archaeon]
MALPLFISEIPIIKKLNINRLGLIIGSLLPDIIDKPILLIGLGSGRFLSHNLFFILIAFLILFLFTKKNLRISIPFLAGLIIHLILDLPEVPIFYPLISYDFVLLEEPLFFWISKLLSDPVVIMTELIGVAILIFIVLNNKLYYWKNINLYLRGSHQTILREEE